MVPPAHFFTSPARRATAIVLDPIFPPTHPPVVTPTGITFFGGPRGSRSGTGTHSPNPSSSSGSSSGAGSGPAFTLSLTDLRALEDRVRSVAAFGGVIDPRGGEAGYYPELGSDIADAADVDLDADLDLDLGPAVSLLDMADAIDYVLAHATNRFVPDETQESEGVMKKSFREHVLAMLTDEEKAEMVRDQSEKSAPIPAPNLNLELDLNLKLDLGPDFGIRLVPDSPSKPEFEPARAEEREVRGEEEEHKEHEKNEEKAENVEQKGDDGRPRPRRRHRTPQQLRQHARELGHLVTDFLRSPGHVTWLFVQVGRTTDPAYVVHASVVVQHLFRALQHRTGRESKSVRAVLATAEARSRPHPSPGPGPGPGLGQGCASAPSSAPGSASGSASVPGSRHCTLDDKGRVWLESKPVWAPIAAHLAARSSVWFDSYDWFVRQAGAAGATKPKTDISDDTGSEISSAITASDSGSGSGSNPVPDPATLAKELRAYAAIGHVADLILAAGLFESSLRIKLDLTKLEKETAARHKAAKEKAAKVSKNRTSGSGSAPGTPVSHEPGRAGMPGRLTGPDRTASPAPSVASVSSSFRSARSYYPSTTHPHARTYAPSCASTMSTFSTASTYSVFPPPSSFPSPLPSPTLGPNAHPNPILNPNLNPSLNLNLNLNPLPTPAPKPKSRSLTALTAALFPALRRRAAKKDAAVAAACGDTVAVVRTLVATFSLVLGPGAWQIGNNTAGAGAERKKDKGVGRARCERTETEIGIGIGIEGGNGRGDRDGGGGGDENGNENGVGPAVEPRPAPCFGPVQRWSIDGHDGY